MNLSTISQTFSVNYDYKLYFTNGLFNPENSLFINILKNYQKGGLVKMIFVVDQQVIATNEYLLDNIKKYGKKHQAHINIKDIIPVIGGEASKNDKSNVERIWNSINKKSICRHSFVVVIGGGAVIDMAGYAAATAHRGVRLIRIPTTVLAQNDAAVGVKNSINAFEKKNFLGTFALPYAIINDLDFLNTLEKRDWIAGIAEALKVALIKDEDFFKSIEKNAERLANREIKAMAPLIHKCAEIHMRHISEGGDPFENGSSRPLDFGHWAAHKLEQITNYELRHGEAVAMGIALDLTYAELIGLIDKNDLERILQVFKTVGFNLIMPISTIDEVDNLLRGIEEFREHLGGELTITLISAIGIKCDVHEVDRDKMREAITLRSLKS
ncbi:MULTISPECIES: 3-dehydroquinate synthase [Croceitalea]|uniref:3-dehydroquinate synthase n=1 Tax=Croceitalea vernalis TaxID=3075599 RepID=A0ABU3BKB4_9FLAO|nr:MULTISPECIES: 3-dehydroquinate synthase [unclassified Croceitalea]MDT0540905.1 3-dehydroquinate synthase [Croceitalea sp. P059]MDT0622592.1 3-dehydroquinate synthase [Croceitalea sp. P007]